MSALSRVRVFAGAAEAVGGSEFSLQVDSIGALLAELNPSTDAHVADVLARCSFLVDGVRTSDAEARIAPGASVDVLPPFAGG
ncbi:MoaD/ThiS family protein [Pseudoclavibacter helvolus]|uniref:MoaD/ThiS family protein n=1 Tax=Pseudoclavibacter helvolus TaxID=255205 RepID=UPI000838906A|nr:MoaD/ThiS family protein [Pseudoclavibacter helvolus]